MQDLYAEPRLPHVPTPGCREWWRSGNVTAIRAMAARLPPRRVDDRRLATRLDIPPGV